MPCVSVPFNALCGFRWEAHYTAHSICNVRSCTYRKLHQTSNGWSIPSLVYTAVIISSFSEFESNVHRCTDRLTVLHSKSFKQVHHVCWLTDPYCAILTLLHLDSRENLMFQFSQIFDLKFPWKYNLDCIESCFPHTLLCSTSLLLCSCNRYMGHSWCCRTPLYSPGCRLFAALKVKFFLVIPVANATSSRSWQNAA